MIDWNKHDNATCVSVTYFDSNGDTIGTSWADRPTQTKTVADAVEQDGEEWTHTWNGRECRVIFTDDYMSWVKGEGLNKLVPTDSLKPIKPKLTKAQAWDRVADGHPAGFIMEEYDII